MNETPKTQRPKVCANAADAERYLSSIRVNCGSLALGLCVLGRGPSARAVAVAERFQRPAQTPAEKPRPNLWTRLTTLKPPHEAPTTCRGRRPAVRNTASDPRQGGRRFAGVAVHVAREGPVRQGIIMSQGTILCYEGPRESILFYEDP